LSIFPRRSHSGRSLVVAALCAAAAAPRASATEPVTVRWTVEGARREALVCAPSRKSPSGKAPLVFVFHGHGGSMRTASQAFRLQDLWPEAAVAYMQGLPTRTDVDLRGVLPGWQRDPGELGDRDLKFFDAALQGLQHKFATDDRRVYATGFSNGASFVYLLWAERARVLAAVAPCAAVIRDAVRLKVPRPLLHIAGRQDSLVPVAQQEAAIAVARRINQTVEQGKPCGQGCTIYTSPRQTPVIALIHPGGHVVPAGGPEVIVKFFQAQALP
jgi:polyhydroxybutyrate depolymerase